MGLTNEDYKERFGHYPDEAHKDTPDNVMMAIMRNIANGTDVHGGFLTKFAEAIVYADLENQRILMPAAREFVTKYNLEHEQLRRNILKPEQYSTAEDMIAQPRHPK